MKDLPSSHNIFSKIFKIYDEQNSKNNTLKNSPTSLEYIIQKIVFLKRIMETKWILIFFFKFNIETGFKVIIFQR